MDTSTFDFGSRGRVIVAENAEALAQQAARLAVDITTVASRDRGTAFLALSGGSTPKRMGEILAAAPYRDHTVWQTMHVFWGDERWAPLESPESNAGVAMRTFLDHVSIPSSQVHPMPTEEVTPEEAARQYAGVLREVVPGPIPVLDLIFLGMGDDGHTASLFPRTPAIHEDQAIVMANFVPKLDAMRLTMTPPILNAARNVVFLVAGAGKAEPLAQVLQGPHNPDDLPAQIVQPESGSLIWLADRAAVGHLSIAGSSGNG